MEKKPLTIRDVSVDSIGKFHTNRAGFQLTPAGYFEKILNAENSEVNRVDTKGLQDSVNDLIEVNGGLVTENDGLQVRLQELQKGLQPLLDKCIPYRKDTDENMVTCIETALEEMAKKEPVEIERKLTPPQFIFEPGREMAEKMQRAIAYDRKKGVLKEVELKDYLQNFTERAFKYFLKEEYSHI